MHAAAVFWTVMVTLSPVAPPDAPLDVAWQHEGDWGLAPTYHDGGTPLAPGDDELGVAQTIYAMSIRAHLDPALVPAGAAPSEAEVNLRELRAPHPMYRLLRATDAALGDDKPVDLYAGEDGIDVGSPLIGRRAGDDVLGWNALVLHNDLGHPVTADAHTVGPEPRLLDSSDRALARADAAAAETCELHTEHGLGDVGDLDPLPCAPALAPVLAPLAPEVLLHAELQRVTVAMDGTVGARPQAQAGQDAGARGAAMAPGEPAPAGGDEAAPAAMVPVQEALPGKEGRQARAAAAIAPEGAHEAMAVAPPSRPGGLAASVLLGLAVAVLLVPLYRRLLTDGVARHEVRERILALVRAQPGLHESAVARELGIGPNLAQYHVRVLAEFGLVEVRRFGGRKCLFAAGQLGRAEKALAMAGQGPGAKVLDLVAAQPGIAQRAIARALGVRESTVKWHLDRLEAAALVEVERSPSGKRVRLAASLTDAPRPAPEGAARPAAEVVETPAAGAGRVVPLAASA